MWKLTGNKEEIELKITKDEAEVLQNYLLRKIMRLEEAGLDDTYCYERLAAIYYKIFKKM